MLSRTASLLLHSLIAFMIGKPLCISQSAHDVQWQLKWSYAEGRERQIPWVKQASLAANTQCLLPALAGLPPQVAQFSPPTPHQYLPRLVPWTYKSPARTSYAWVCNLCIHRGSLHRRVVNELTLYMKGLSSESIRLKMSLPFKDARKSASPQQ